MTEKQAIDWCEQFTDNLIMVNVDTKKRTLGLQAMQVCKSALSKQIPKKVEKIKSGFKSFNCVCPECAYRQISQIEGEWIAGQHYNYCSNCGQALDWSDTNDT